eukprot:snap_masked-scaffold_20-processed-gene-0.38-mRNA-1 protein AED:1.00 eAED:1.00 QI:0/0/0/0/1/1/2/0/329
MFCEKEDVTAQNTADKSLLHFRGSKIEKTRAHAKQEYHSIFSRLGKSIQTQEAQFAVIVLHLIDLAITFNLFYRKSTSFDEIFSLIGDAGSNLTRTGITKVIKAEEREMYLSTMENLQDLFLFCYTILMASCFGLKLFTHLGYALDVTSGLFLVMVRGGFIYSTHAMIQRANLVNVFRLWRIYRFLGAIVSTMEEDIRRVEDILSEKQLEIDNLKQDVKDEKCKVKREAKAVQSMERAFDHQKEHVATLEEALKIAAEAMAETSKHDELSGLGSIREEGRQILQGIVEESQTRQFRRAEPEPSLMKPKFSTESSILEEQTESFFEVDNH